MTERFKSLFMIYLKIKFCLKIFLYIFIDLLQLINLLPQKVVIVSMFYVRFLIYKEINWDVESENLKNKIVKELSKTIMPDLENNITDVFWMNPKDFKNDYNSMHGAGFSIAPIFTQSAWFRYHNKDKKIKNLYFSAAGSHPGAGIPGVLSSAKVVENIIKSELK